jgi:hypothetical protein
MNSGDILLYALSAKGRLSWAQFKTTFDILATKGGLKYENAVSSRNLALRNLDSLGHCDFFESDTGRDIVAAPTFLVRLPTSQPLAVLAGARTPSTVEKLKTAAQKTGIKVDVLDQHGELAEMAPSKLLLRAENESALVEYAQVLGIAFDCVPPAWKLLGFGMGLEDVTERLKWDETPELNWRCEDFDPERRSFKAPKEPRPEFRLSRYLDPRRGSYRFYLWDGKLSAVVDCDWGRFMALKQAGFDVLYFDPRRNFLLSPKTVALPRLLARSVVLCSGSIPRHLPGLGGTRSSGYNVFELVPKALAERLAQKLGQPVSECEIALAEEAHG